MGVRCHRRHPRGGGLLEPHRRDDDGGGMRLAESLRARAPRTSAHSIVLIMGVSTVVLALLTTFGPNSVSSATQAASWAGVAALVTMTAVCVLVPAERLDRAGVFPAIGLSGVLMICVLN